MRKRRFEVSIAKNAGCRTLVTEMITKARFFYPREHGGICGDKKFTYSQFGKRVDGLSDALLDLAIIKGDIVPILHRNCHYYLQTYFAAMQVLVLGARERVTVGGGSGVCWQRWRSLMGRLMSF